MPLHKEVRILPYTAEQMYAVVADIERYPEFLPWCTRLDVLDRQQQGRMTIVTAELFVAYHGLSEHYTSRVQLDPDARTIEAAHVKGPFKKLDTHWRFVPHEKGAEVHFLIDFAFKNVLLTAVAGVAFGMVATRMAESFVRRAQALYDSDQLKQ